MGYETHFRLKGELDPKFKTCMKENPSKDFTEAKDILLATCLKSYISDNDYIRLTKAYKAINFAARAYILLIAEGWKYDLQRELEKNNNETWFCGWSCAHNESTWASLEAIEEWFTSNLFIEAITDIDETRDKDERYNDIKSTIDDLEDCVRDVMRYMFIDRYRDSEDAWESDGYDRKYPEELED